MKPMFITSISPHLKEMEKAVEFISEIILPWIRASSEKSHVSLRCKLEGLLGQALEENLLVISAVICKACCRRVERLHKTFESIQELKIDFQRTETLRSSGATEPMPASLSKETYVKFSTLFSRGGGGKEYLSLQEIMMRLQGHFQATRQKISSLTPFLPAARNNGK
eukprot:gene1625-1803_t